MWACNRGHHECAEALVDAGAAVDMVSNGGWTALMEACEFGHHECAQALIEAGAAVDMVSNNGWTALMWACDEGHHECALALMDAGATVDKVNNNGSTALMLACQTRPNSSSSYCVNKAACALALLESMLPIREVVVADPTASLKLACERHQVLQIVLRTRSSIAFAPAALARASAHVNDVHSIIVEFARDMLIQRQPENLGLDGLTIVGDTSTSAFRAPIEANYSY